MSSQDGGYRTADWWLLTKREKEIIELAALGYSAAETGKELFIAAVTVKFHRTTIFQKLGAKSITHAVALAFKAGYLAVDGASSWPDVRVNGVEYVPAASEIRDVA